MQQKKSYSILGCIGVLILMALVVGCVLEAAGANPWVPPTTKNAGGQGNPVNSSDSASSTQPAGRSQPAHDPNKPVFTPTPDSPHALPTLRSQEQQYVIQSGDTLRQIASRYGVSLNALITANQLENPDLLEIGQMIIIPAQNPQDTGSGFKIIPDSELIYGPGSVGFDIAAFLAEKKGYLASYSETIDEKNVSAAGVIQRISYEYSVNPRLLIALIEYQSGWVLKSQPASETLDYPLGLVESNHKGLYRQLSWTAANLNKGYYLWRVNGVSSWILSDGNVVPANNTIDAGTAGVQNLMSLFYSKNDWEQAVGENGLFRTYTGLFGNPFDYSVEPILPANLQQPAFILPFESGVAWSFTGGPHSGWGTGSAWAALDFAPPGEALGCVSSNAWVTAVAAGVIVRAADGAVVEDLDGDGNEQTGWTVLYMHIETRDRVSVGVKLEPGDRIGHPSCEGGVSSGTHTHIARRYNGEWIPADGSLPFNLNGWISAGDGVEYDGTLSKNGQIIEAWVDRRPENQIQR
jgi:murein DD-endopeptidase MepM/ murein hydrolase activator NlpD